MICEYCGKEYEVPEGGNWLKDGTVGIKHGSSDSKRFCCFKCGQQYSQDKRRGKWISPFADKTVREKAIRTIQERYGVNNVFASEKVKDKIKQSNIKRYGVENVMLDEKIKNKVRQKQKDLYGGIGFASDSVKEKIQQTNVIRYGKAFPQSTDEIKKKIVETNLKHRGVSAPMQDPIVRAKSIQACLDKYGVEWNCMTLEARKAGGIISKINKAWANDIENLGYKVEFEKGVGRSSYDLYIPEKNLLIDINPTVTHQCTEPRLYDLRKLRAVHKTYHVEKLDIALKAGYDCMMIWDWDSKEKILQSLEKKEEVRLKDCVIKEVDDITAVNSFLNKYHLQGSCKNQSICIGLYHNTELISIMTFGKPRYTNKYEYEWLRYASYKIVHRAVSAMFKYFINKYDPKNVVSYCDTSKFNGKMFGHLGFKLKRKPYPSRHFSNPSKKLHYTENEVNKLGACKILSIPQIPLSTGQTNATIMIANGFLEVYDCGQATYIWSKENNV